QEAQRRAILRLVIRKNNVANAVLQSAEASGGIRLEIALLLRKHDGFRNSRLRFCHRHRHSREGDEKKNAGEKRSILPQPDSPYHSATLAHSSAGRKSIVPI